MTMPKWFLELEAKAKANEEEWLRQSEVQKQQDLEKAKANVSNIMANLQEQQNAYGRKVFGSMWDKK